MSDELEFSLTLYPAPVLRKRAEPVAAFDDELRATVEAMYRRMRASQGVGLAAPQVGLGLRILVLNPGADGDGGEGTDGEGESPSADRGLDLTLINPEIVSRSGPTTTFEEGCLSFPGIFAEVRRPARCRVKAFDVAGNPLEAEYDGFVSRIIQHEFDHLEGVLLVDRMSPADKLRNKAALEELKERYRVARQPAGR